LRRHKKLEERLTLNQVRARQALPLEIKEAMTLRRLTEFIEEYGEDNVAVCFSGGG